MPVPTNGWNDGGWNKKLPQFDLLAEMLGLPSPPMSPDELQGLFSMTGSAKVFADSVQPFLERIGKPQKVVADTLEDMEEKLGLLEHIPFMSLRGMEDPRSFAGVAIWPAGITNWTERRLERIKLAQKQGAYFERIIVLGSVRVCDQPADRRHWHIRDVPPGHEPMEWEVQRDWISRDPDKARFEVVKMPPQKRGDKPLTLEQQLKHFVESGQYDKWVAGKKIFVPSTPNSLYVPLHVMRLLGHENVWFSQSAARAMREMPDYWAPELQDIMTTPSGIVRLWVELLHNGCIDERGLRFVKKNRGGTGSS